MAITVNFTGQTSIAGTEVLPTGFVASVGDGVPYGDEDRIGIMKGRVDVGLIPSASTKTSTDVYQAIHIPAFFKIVDAWFVVVEAEATNTTLQMELGITGGTTNGFVTAATVAVANVAHCSNATTYTAAGGYTLVAHDTLDILCSVAAPTNVVVDVYALVVDMRAPANR